MSISGGAPLKYSDNISFATAFAQARKIFGEDGLFQHRGKIYSTKGGEMAPEPNASMEENVYQSTAPGEEEAAASEESNTEDNAEGSQQKPAPKLKRKQETTETNVS